MKLCQEARPALIATNYTTNAVHMGMHELLRHLQSWVWWHKTYQPWLTAVPVMIRFNKLEMPCHFPNCVRAPYTGKAMEWQA